MADERAPLLHQENEKDALRVGDEEEQLKRSVPRRSRWFGVAPFVALCFLLFWTVALDAFDDYDYEESDVCLTPECVLASAELLTSRSPNYASIDPCTDFRSYMCEGFDNTHDLRPDQSDVGSFSVLAERGQSLLRHILEAPMPKSTFSESLSVDEDNFDKLRDAYDACLNESAIAEINVTPLNETVQMVLQFFEADKDTKKSLSEANSFLLSIGIQPFIELDIRVRPFPEELIAC